MTRTRILIAATASAALLALAATAAQGAAPAGATGATGAATPALSATLAACTTDPTQSAREAVFQAQTVAASVPGTVSMSVQFDLEERSGNAAVFAPLPRAGLGFDTWETSSPHVGIFIDKAQVTGLPAPAAFRVLVRARWFNRRHRILYQTSAISAVCTEPLLAPDLAVGRITRAAGTTPGTVQYSVEVHNAGNADAGPFGVSLTVGGIALAPVTISTLPAGGTQLAVFTGPACAAGSSVTATADPAGQVQEPADAHRTRTLACPVP